LRKIKYNNATYTKGDVYMPRRPLAVINTAIDYDLKTWLQDYARRTNKSMTSALEDALIDYLTKNDKKEEK